MLDFRLYTFISVCRNMNFTKASEELCITQPAVSQHIHYLENEYNVKLFEYVGKTLSITNAGKILFQKAQAILNDEKIIIEQMKHNSLQSSTLSLGVTKTIGDFVIAKPIAQYMKNHPTTLVKMQESNTQVLLEKLRKGEINFAIVEGFFPEEEFDSTVFSTEEFIAVCSEKKQFQNEQLLLRELLSERLIVREKGSGTRNILEKALDVRNLCINQFSNVTEIESMNAIISLIQDNCGISFLYKTAVKNLLLEKKIKEIPLKDFMLKHDFSFIWNKGSIYGKEYKEICKELQKK